jgi:hypothetical protein
MLGLSWAIPQRRVERAARVRALSGARAAILEKAANASPFFGLCFLAQGFLAQD